MTTMAIDLNADLGESYGRWTLGDDAAMLALVSSANVACGFHAGDPATLRTTCVQAVTRGVAIGAQVSYPDLAGFGRRFMDISAGDLAAAVIYQLGALAGLARAAGGDICYLKPHGALYHAVVDHEEQAGAVVEAVTAYDANLTVLGPAGSALLSHATKAGLHTATEYFVDRSYTPDGRLVDRRLPNSMVTDVDLAVSRAVTVAEQHSADSMCIHGDSPGAVTMARAVRAALDRQGLEVEPFVSPPRDDGP